MICYAPNGENLRPICYDDTNLLIVYWIMTQLLGKGQWQAHCMSGAESVFFRETVQDIGGQWTHTQ